MDLAEMRTGNTRRHPWELARARAVESIVLKYGPAAVTGVLDYGCGDGFTGRSVLGKTGAERYCGVDLHLTAEQCREWSSEDGKVRFTNDDSTIEARFSLALLCDVIEHVEDDVALLRGVIGRLEDGGRALVTVPAFQSLFSAHDRALRHFRRYSLPELRRAAESAGFEVLASGYLFGSLLLPRALTSLREKWRRSAVDLDELGIGGWTGGPLVTKTIALLLEADNGALLGLNRLGIKLPGLTTWAMCRRAADAAHTELGRAA